MLDSLYNEPETALTPQQMKGGSGERTQRDQTNSPADTMSAGITERTCLMKRLLATIAALAAITTVPACADKTESKKNEKPFGTDFSTILEDAGIEPATDDYIVQCYPETLNIFSNGEITESIDATFISVESYNDNGESIQNEICYLFEEIDESENYFAYASEGIYEVSLSEKTVFIDTILCVSCPQ